MAFAAVTSELVPETLSEYGAITRAALKDYLPSQEPRRHLYDLITDYPHRGGKMMRPSICIATARVFGAPVSDAIRSAVSIELLHNALLIHDDIEDESLQRRGRPALHQQHGIALSINAGDTLALMSLRPLIDNEGWLGPRLAMRILEDTERMARETAEGQAMELGWRRDNSLDLGDQDYLKMVLKKTCWLGVIYPCRIGAIIGSKDSVDLEPFVRFGFFLGAAFQIQDDLLNLNADERYGKEADGDIWEAKRTLMLIRLLQRASPLELERLRRILGATRGTRTAGQVRWIRELYDKYDCIDHARKTAHALAGAAVHECARALHHLPPTRDKLFLEGLATWVFERT
jgi:geranylgeranyl diphosphate synthase type II